MAWSVQLLILLMAVLYMAGWATVTAADLRRALSPDSGYSEGTPAPLQDNDYVMQQAQQRSKRSSGGYFIPVYKKSGYGGGGYGGYGGYGGFGSGSGYGTGGVTYLLANTGSGGSYGGSGYGYGSGYGGIGQPQSYIKRVTYYPAGNVGTGVHGGYGHGGGGGGGWID